MEFMPEYYALNLEKNSFNNKPVNYSKNKSLVNSKPFTMFYILKNKNDNLDESFNQIFSKSISRNIENENEAVKTNRIKSDLSFLLKNKPNNFVLFNVTQTNN